MQIQAIAGGLNFVIFNKGLQSVSKRLRPRFLNVSDFKEMRNSTRRREAIASFELEIRKLYN